MKDLGKRTLQISIGLGAIVGLIGCGEEASSVQAAGRPRGLRVSRRRTACPPSTGCRRRTACRPRTACRRRTACRPRTAFRRRTACRRRTVMMTTSTAARRSPTWCAARWRLATRWSSRTRAATTTPSPAAIGLCPEWKNGDVHTNERCITGVSACMMAHVNTAGIHVPLWLDNNSQLSNGSYPINWGVDRVNYPMQEGTFFGDIIDTGSLSNIGLGGSHRPGRVLLRRRRLPGGRLGRRRRTARCEPNGRALQEPLRQRRHVPERLHHRQVLQRHQRQLSAGLVREPLRRLPRRIRHADHPGASLEERRHRVA